MISLLAYDSIESEQLLNAHAKEFNQIVNADFFLNSVLPEVLAHNPHVDVKLIDVDMDFSYIFNKNCTENLKSQVRILTQRKVEFIASIRIKTSSDQCEVFGLAFYQKDRENTLCMERVSVDADTYDNKLETYINTISSKSGLTRIITIYNRLQDAKIAYVRFLENEETRHRNGYFFIQWFSTVRCGSDDLQLLVTNKNTSKPLFFFDFSDSEKSFELIMSLVEQGNDLIFTLVTKPLNFGNKLMAHSISMSGGTLSYTETNSLSFLPNSRFLIANELETYIKFCSLYNRARLRWH